MKEFLGFFVFMNVLILIAFVLTAIGAVLVHFLGVIFGTIVTIWVTFGCSYLIFKVIEE